VAQGLVVKAVHLGALIRVFAFGGLRAERLALLLAGLLHLLLDFVWLLRGVVR
jgi:hypothetical protein